jgi:hypothetical protein
MQATGAVGSRVAGGCSRVGKMGGWCGGLVRRADVAGRFGGWMWRCLQLQARMARACTCSNELRIYFLIHHKYCVHMV